MAYCNYIVTVRNYSTRKLHHTEDFRTKEDAEKHKKKLYEKYDKYIYHIEVVTRTQFLNNSDNFD